MSASFIRPLKKSDLVIFSILTGILATFVKGYRFGTGDQIEQLPIIFRHLNSSYLPNDFFTNVASGFGPRFYYAWFISHISSIATVPYIFLILTILSNVAVALATSVTAYSLFRSKRAGIWAAVLVMTLSFNQIGGATDLFFGELLPQALVKPLLLFGLWYGIRNQLFIALLFAFIATPFHPALGLGLGGIVLISVITSRLFESHWNIGMLFKLQWKEISASLIVFGISILLWVIPLSRLPHINSQEFIQIFGYERSPGHILPQTYSVRLVIEFLALGIASIVSFLWVMRQKVVSSRALRIIGLYSAIVFLLCLGQVLFVDTLFPRFWAVLFPFRHLYLVKWFGFILIAGVISHLYESTKKEDQSIVTVLITSLLSPITIGFAFVTLLYRKWLVARFGFATSLLTPFAVLLIVILYYVRVVLPSQGIPLHFVIVTLVALYFIGSKSLYPRLLSSIVVVSIVIVLFLQPLWLLPQGIASSIAFLKPTVTLDDLSGEIPTLGRFIKKNTPQDSIILVPRYLGQIRLIGERPLVVDFKAIPFQDQGMVLWYERIVAVFGKITTLDLAERDKEYEDNYKNLTDSKIRSLQAQYHCTYAILYKETPTVFPVLFATEQYKLVQLD